MYLSLLSSLSLLRLSYCLGEETSFASQPAQLAGQVAGLLALRLPAFIHSFKAPLTRDAAFIHSFKAPLTRDAGQ